MNIEIRPGTDDELETIIDSVYEEFGPTTGYKSREDVLKDYEFFLEQPENSVLSAYVDDEFAGFMLYRRIKDAGDIIELKLVPILSAAMKLKGRLGRFLSENLEPMLIPHEHNIPRPRKNDFYKDTTVVFPEFRKMGISLLFTQKIQEFARKRNRKIYTFAMDDSGALEMNLKAGFQAMAHMNNAYCEGRGGTLLGWRKS